MVGFLLLGGNMKFQCFDSSGKIYSTREAAYAYRADHIESSNLIAESLTGERLKMYFNIAGLSIFKARRK